MAKQIVHIGVAVSTIGTGREGIPNNGIMPGSSNIINIAAACGDAYMFTENIAPQSGTYGESAFWAKHPDVLTQLMRKPVPLEEAMVKLRLWLKQFQGTLVACSSAVDFWHLLHAFFQTGKDCPFGTLPIDTTTLHMLRNNKQRPSAVTDKVVPAQVAKARWELVTGGAMPRFGDKPAGLKRKAAPPPGLNVGRARVRPDEAFQREIRNLAERQRQYNVTVAVGNAAQPTRMWDEPQTHLPTQQPTATRVRYTVQDLEDLPTQPVMTPTTWATDEIPGAGDRR